MLILLLEIWGALFYTLNKIFFSLAERSISINIQKNYFVIAWAVYFIALPAWIIVFISERNWIAATVQLTSMPTMLIGIIIAYQGYGQQPKWLDILARLMILVGLIVSLLDFGGLVSITQILELTLSLGFLLGTYFLAKQNPWGYIGLILGNISCAYLMNIQGYYLLMAQQIISLAFVADAFFVQKKMHDI